MLIEAVLKFQVFGNVLHCDLKSEIDTLDGLSRVSSYAR